MLLRQGAEELSGGESLLNLLRGVGRTENSGVWEELSVVANRGVFPGH